jgi:hypothetical protein
LLDDCAEAGSENPAHSTINIASLIALFGVSMFQGLVRRHNARRERLRLRLEIAVGATDAIVSAADLVLGNVGSAVVAMLPLGLGYVEGVTHDYRRHGTTTLFAALDTANGKVLTKCRPHHRHQEYLSFLREIEKNVPKNLEVHIIVDNYATQYKGRPFWSRV